MEKIKNIIGWVSLLFIIIIGVSIAVYTVLNPELTNTQIFLKKIWLYVPLTFCVLGLNWGFNRK